MLKFKRHILNPSLWPSVQVKKLPTTFFMFLRVPLTHLHRWLAFFTKFPRHYRCSQTTCHVRHVQAICRPLLSAILLRKLTNNRLRRLTGLWGKKSQRDLGEGMLGVPVQCTKDSYAVLTVEALCVLSWLLHHLAIRPFPF